MEPEIDINILVNLFVQKLAAIQKENTFLVFFNLIAI